MRIRTTVRDHLDRAAGYQRFLYAVGAVLLASAAFHLVVLVATGGFLEGPVSWRKPILFGEAFGLTAATIGGVMTYLPRRAVLGWLVAGVLGATCLGEVGWVALQQWRGVPSHFNFATAFDANAFSFAGNLILLTSVSILVFTVWAFASLKAPASLGIAIRVGLGLLLLALGFGLAIIQNGTARVFDPATGAFYPEALDRAAIFGQAGRMKIPHAMSLHAIQVLPLLAFLAGRASWPERVRARVVAVAAAGYVALVGWAALQAFRGLAPFALDAAAGLLLGAGILGLGGSWVAVLREATLSTDPFVDRDRRA